MVAPHDVRIVSPAVLLRRGSPLFLNIQVGDQTAPMFRAAFCVPKLLTLNGI